MGWRDWMRNHVIAAHGVNPSVTEPDLAAALLAMPTPDRIALARELLVGTGRVVAEPIDRRHTTTPVDGYNAGWNAARAAMLGDEG